MVTVKVPFFRRADFLIPIAIATALIISVSVVSAVDLERGLVAYYSFDDCSAKDLSGNGNDGIIYGAKCVDGKFGKALRFDGVDDYVYLPTSTLGNWNQLTIAVWVKAPQYTGSGWPPFVGSETTDASHNIQFGIWQNTRHLHLEVDTDTGNYPMEGSLSIPWNEWFHAVMVYDGLTLTEYINGMRGKSISASGNLKDINYLHIGHQYH